MGQRAKCFANDEYEWSIMFGTYALLLFYAKEIDAGQAKKLYWATTSEYWYRVKFGLFIENLTFGDSTVHFNTCEITDVIDFIDNEITPALNNEKKDILEKYGGIEGFVNLFYLNKEFIDIGIYEDDYYQSEPQELAFQINLLKEFMQSAVEAGQPYEVYVR